ncbi:MAG: hypothetical protein QNJ33_02195 [Crocosphaera sp.]|nr:hypothetical protein [Crocosphaera sp.]
MKTPEIILNCINPKFLQRADRYLLLNYPRIWVTKIHYVFYYGLLANIILNSLVRLLIQPHQIDEFIRFIIVIVMLAELVAFVYWFSRQCLFNIEQEYGNTNWINEFLEIIIYTICTLIITLCSLTMTWTAIDKIANTDPIIHKDTKCEENVVWEDKFCTLGDINCDSDKSSKKCNDIRNFMATDINEDTDNLPYDIHWFFHAIFAILGILILMIKKHSNWRTLGLLAIYVILLTIISVFLGIFLHNAEIDLLAFLHIPIDQSNLLGLRIGMGIILCIIFLSIFASTQLAKKSSYDQFLYINFIMIPFVIFVFTLFFGSLLEQSNKSYYSLKETVLDWVKFFLFFLFFVPLQKWILIRTQSLPKK